MRAAQVEQHAVVSRHRDDAHFLNDGGRRAARHGHVSILHAEEHNRAGCNTFSEAGKVGVWTKADSVTLIDDFEQLLRADGVIGTRAATLTPLAGGVSSEIYLVNDAGREFVVKRALPKLKVKQEWFADISRNGNEAAYLNYVARLAPDNVPHLKYVSAEHGYFCMEYLGDAWRNWKQMMLAGRCDPEIARAAGGLLGRIHARSAHDPEARDRFRTVANFEQLRIEPYLLATARRHPQLKPAFEEEAARLRAARSVLAHGDFSPKNILVRPGRLVILDCEVAWYGDAAFDVAFLLNHLFLKSAARPAAMGRTEWPARLSAPMAAPPTSCVRCA